MFWAAFLVALLPAAVHWWWTRSVVVSSTSAEAAASAVLPERSQAVAQRVSFVTILCTLAIAAIAGWKAMWILPVQIVALTSTTHRARRAMFGETWPFQRYLWWRMRAHVGMFGLWWFVALAPAVIAGAHSQARWWLVGLSVAIAVAWHHWNGRVLLVLLGASRLERPDLDGHFDRVFNAARVPTPVLWRAGAAGGMLANAFTMVTLGQRGVLFLDSLLEQLGADEITAILAHEVAHLEQFNRRRVLGLYLVSSVLILLVMIGSAVASAVAPGVESWIWVISFGAVFAGAWLRGSRMRAHETDADLRAIELCGDPEALIRALTRIYTLNHIPRRWSAQFEERATHPSLARRIRAIRDRTTASQAGPVPIERVVVQSSEAGRCALIDRHRIGFLWIDETADANDVIDRASRVEMIAYDQLSELRLSTKRHAIELIAVDRAARRWSMPIHEADAAAVQSALDRVDHLVVAPAPTRDLGIRQRVAVLIVVLLAATFNAIGAVLVPALLALRRPERPIMMALAAALAGTAIASVNEIDVSVVRIGLLGILTLTVLWSARRLTQEEHQDAGRWTSIERIGLLLPIVAGLILAAANAGDLFGLHSTIRDRSWFTAALAAMAAFHLIQGSQRPARRAGWCVAILATASFVIGSPWFLLHAVADPLVAEMPWFSEKPTPMTALAQHAVSGNFTRVRLTPDGEHVLLFGEFRADAAEVDDVADSTWQLSRFLVSGFDGWSREIRALEVAVVDEQRLLALDRGGSGSTLRAEDLRTGGTLWTIALPHVEVSSVQAAPDGRWRAFARRGNQFERIDGKVGISTTTSTRFKVTADKGSYVDVPRSDEGSVALAIAPLWKEPMLGSMLTDWRETTQLLRVDSTRTTELATSHLRVECPAAPIDVTGHVCVSFDGRSSRFWRIDLSNGQLVPIAETRHVIWNPSRTSQERMAGIADGRPLLAALDSQTLVTLIPDTYCWAQDVDVSRDVLVTICGEPGTTRVTQYRLPADSH